MSGNEAVGKGSVDIIISEAFRAALLPARFIPAHAAALIGSIGAGALIGSVIDRHPGFGERLRELDGKVFYFEATDAAAGVYILFKDGRGKVVPNYAGVADVTMRGEAKVLFDLFLGRVDPDTVFFSRRLEINGDTAAAILLKNLLAGLS
ncbi:MAG: SCP2 sterol-binding domain-containing protein [Deltaproteobacteria bacterium]|nr:SCP2 sterol-binding domain-containing protein [Deltaproteobacteria bacterium]